jgi:pimeloyl-ACP methyl ester carboxylesterase
VYYVLQTTIELSRELHESRSVRNLARLFKKVRRPVKGGKLTGIPTVAAYMVAYMIRRSQKRNEGRPNLKGRLGKVVDVLYTFDADFSQAFVDGRIYEGLNHADALERAACPLLLLHANWLRHPEYGLVGAMDDDDAQYARQLARHIVYRRIDSDHVIHSENPELFAQEIEDFLSGLE